jgi:TRAP-type C4-dicarboxylate transport system substrate-binding protein
MSKHDRTTLFELKEKAKWSTVPEESKAAIKELSNHGEDAMSELQEIMRITAYEDIKNACAEAIMSIQTRSKEVEINKTSYTTYDSNSTADSSTTATKNQKKEGEFENEAESTREEGVKLADMPR